MIAIRSFCSSESDSSAIYDWPIVSAFLKTFSLSRDENNFSFKFNQFGPNYAIIILDYKVDVKVRTNHMKNTKATGVRKHYRGY